jgi:hypothetical protein
MHLRGTGESFAANVGGRMIGTSAAFVTTQVAAFKIDETRFLIPGDTSFTRVAYTAAAVTFTVYAIGVIVSFWLPEPSGDELPE